MSGSINRISERRRLLDVGGRHRMGVPASDHDFCRLGDGRYQFVVPELSTDFDIDQVRRERYQLHAELTVYCALAGVKPYDRVLFTASVNLSNIRDRDALARSLGERTSTAKVQVATWTPVIDELSTRVHAAERRGAR